jgi:hypothetical protein
LNVCCGPHAFADSPISTMQAIDSFGMSWFVVVIVYLVHQRLPHPQSCL